MQAPVLRRTELGHPAVEFLGRTLDGGKSLARALRDSRDLTQGRIYAFLPESVDAANIVKWEQGLGMSSRASRNALTEALAEIANPVPQAICLLEDAAMRRGEEWRVNSPIRLIGDEIYHVARSITPGDIKSAILAAKAGMPDIGVISVTPENWPDAQGAEIGAQLSALVDSALAVFVGAFDGEGYVILEF
jgi:hypothetical protein